MGVGNALTATEIDKVWGPSRATGAGSLGLSARLSTVANDRGVVERSRPPSKDTHAVSVWIEGSTFSELYLDGAPRFAQVRDSTRFQTARAGESVRAVLSQSTGSCIDLYMPNAILTDFIDAEMSCASTSFELLPAGLEQDAEITSLAHRVAEEIQRPSIASRAMIDGATLFLSAALIRRWSNRAEPARPVSGGLAAWQVRRAIAAMHASPDGNLTLSQLSQEVGLSPYHFARAFKISTGEPPHRHHLRIRLERARELIEATDRKIGDIAAEVGYEDSSYFSRAFRTHFGIRPNAYRILRRT
jgi:AraC-like DNA-binding protein